MGGVPSCVFGTAKVAKEAKKKGDILAFYFRGFRFFRGCLWRLRAIRSKCSLG